jgi:ABC-type branched-chain amino acid transport systems, ATPase component
MYVQIPRVFPDLTVAENMEIYQSHRTENIFKTLFERTDESTGSDIDQLLSFVGIKDMKTARAGSLSTGQQKLLNLGAALLREPAVILLDEPTAGVNPKLVEEIKEMIQKLGQDGQTFVIIEHDMDVVREITEFVYVLANGANLVSGTPEFVLNEDEVLEAYFGE